MNICVCRTFIERNMYTEVIHTYISHIHTYTLTQSHNHIHTLIHAYIHHSGAHSNYRQCTRRTRPHKHRSCTHASRKQVHSAHIPGESIHVAAQSRRLNQRITRPLHRAIPRQKQKQHQRSVRTRAVYARRTSATASITNHPRNPRPRFEHTGRTRAAQSVFRIDTKFQQPQQPVVHSVSHATLHGFRLRF